MTLTLKSPAFSHLGEIPRRYTCEGADVSPPLAWSGVPEGTRGLALVVDDPDAPDPAAPKMTWVHWVLYNLPPTAGALPEGVETDALPPGTLEGLNDWKQPGYGGPCPPIGRHRYFQAIRPRHAPHRPGHAAPGAIGQSDGGPRPRPDRAHRRLREGRRVRVHRRRLENRAAPANLLARVAPANGLAP